MAEISYPFVVERGTYTTVIVANMADTDRLAVEVGIPNDPTGCDPTKRLWTPARRCGVNGVVDGSVNPMVFDVPANYRLVWQTEPNPDIVVYVNEGGAVAAHTVTPQAT